MCCMQEAGAGAAKPSLPDMNAAAAAWEDESAGISEPLYGILDELFRMQGRGFIRPLARPLPCPWSQSLSAWALTSISCQTRSCSSHLLCDFVLKLWLTQW